MLTRIARTATGLAVALVAAGALAQVPQVYRYVDPATGRVVYSDRPPPADAKGVQTKRVDGNFVESSEPSLTAQIAADRFPATLYTFECGEVCQNAEALLNKRGVPFTMIDVQKDEQAMLRLRNITGEDRAPVLTLGDKVVVKGFNEARWQAALDEAGYPKAPSGRKGPGQAPAAARAEPPPPPPTPGTQSLAPPPRGGDYPK
ncbi:MAG: glutaredoxin family protein [Burkholderiales bacterium]